MMNWSIGLPPWPPYSLGQLTAVQPRAMIFSKKASPSGPGPARVVLQLRFQRVRHVLGDEGLDLLAELLLLGCELEIHGGVSLLRTSPQAASRAHAFGFGLLRIIYSKLEIHPWSVFGDANQEDRLEGIAMDTLLFKPLRIRGRPAEEPDRVVADAHLFRRGW